MIIGLLPRLLPLDVGGGGIDSASGKGGDRSGGSSRDNGTVLREEDHCSSVL